jgi:hypothetical protein
MNAMYKSCKTSFTANMSHRGWPVVLTPSGLSLLNPGHVFAMGDTGLYARFVPYGWVTHIFTPGRVEVRLNPDHPGKVRS